jgi:arylsulfatase A-like enzyme
MVADTLRADRLGCYGASRPATPHLDALAARGARVEEVYANSSWTVPSTASLLTGLHPSSHGLMTYKDRLRESAVSLAEVLARDGYVSAGIAANPVLSEKLGFGAGFDVWEEEIARGVLRRHREAPVVATLEALGLHEPEEHFPRAEEVVRRGLEWLDRRPAGPFFLYLHFLDPHDPYAPPPPYDTRYLRPGAAQMRMRFGTLPEIMQGLRPAGAVELEALLGLYDGSVAYMDDQVGRFLAALEERGLLRDTLVVFTSDHGEEFNEHGGLGHEHTLYEELVRIPLVAAGPGIVEGRVLRGPVRLIDVAPTILEAAGLTFPVPVEGASFLGALAGEQDLEPREVFMEEAYIGIRSPVHALRAIRAGDLKLIGSTFHVQGIGPWRWELYDLRADPSERRDLAGDRPAEAASLQDRLEAWARRPRAAAPGEAPLDRELEEKLRALGYIQ